MGEGQNEDTINSPIPWRSGTLHIILSSSLIGVMGVALISPILPELRPVFQVSDAEIGLIITAYSFPGIFITPFVGYAADRIGRKWVLIPLLFTFGISGAGIAFTSDFTVALGLRFLQGIGATALVMLAITLIGDIYEGARRDTLIGINASTISVGGAFFPLIGGSLAVLHWNVPFLFFGVAILVGLLAMGALNEPTETTAVQLNVYAKRIYAVVRLPQALALFAAMFSTVFIYYGAVITALPLLLSDEFALNSSQIGLILAMVFVTNGATSSLYGRISTHRSPPELISLGFAFYGSSLLLIWLAPTPILIAMSLFLFGIGLGLVLPSIDTKIITLVTKDLRAGVMGVRTSMLRLGQTIGPIGFTFTVETFFPSTVYGYRSLMLLTGAIAIGAGSVLYLYYRLYH